MERVLPHVAVPHFWADLGGAVCGKARLSSWVKEAAGAGYFRTLADFTACSLQSCAPERRRENGRQNSNVQFRFYCFARDGAFGSLF